MQVLLMRHAAAALSAARDSERPLTHRGRTEAAAVARVLLASGWSPDRVVTSPYLRARQTGEIVAATCGIEPPIALPEVLDADASLVGILLEIGASRPLVVGHQPTLPALAGRLLGGARLTFPTSAVAALSLPGNPRAATAHLHFLLDPALLHGTARPG